MDKGQLNQTTFCEELELLSVEDVSRLNSDTGQENIEEVAPVTTGSEKESPSQRLVTQEIFKDLKKELETAGPWFFKQMPPQYKYMISEENQKSHILDIIAGKVLSDNQVVERNNSISQQSTIIAPESEEVTAIERLASMIAKLENPKFGGVFSSLDTRVSIATFRMSDYVAIGSWAKSGYEEKYKEVLNLMEKYDTPGIDSYLGSLDKDYVEKATSRMIRIGYFAFQHCKSHENSYVNLKTFYDEDPHERRVRVDVGLKRFPVSSAIENVIGIFNRYGFIVRRVLANEVRPTSEESVTILHVIASLRESSKVEVETQSWRRVLKGLKTLSYVDHGDEFGALLLDENPLSLNETNLIRAMANWAHIFLSKVNPYYYARDRVSRIVCRNPEFMHYGIQYFRSCFDPRFKGDRVERTAELTGIIQQMILDCPNEIERETLKECFNFLKHILKTNYFLITKGALTFRMDPKILDKRYYPETPFGIFYFMGRDFRGFQVRYRDIARGGVRVIMPRTFGDFDSALAGLFDEVNGLASAQQLKNKDIPEGGSKAAMVIRPGGNREMAVKTAISGILDLITTIEPGSFKLNPSIIDYYGKEEIIYLGPDENMTNDLISWITQHALRRGYPYAWAFMSSKPDFGINHKEYGVTSEGVNVFLDNVLDYLKLKGPDRTFRVKMTGGPDGDVGGNELSILHREYGEKCCVVAIADGFGAACDPDGLNWKELLRLVKEGKSIVEFQKSYLSQHPDAYVIAADTPEHVRTRNNLYATVEAEIFIPAGGRPFTVNETNWQKYLLSDGRSSSLAIVEGANIFFTPEARKKLVENGVVVIKDSSANKCGVIASSYEIIACLCLSPEEFADIKEAYVTQVVATLKKKADNEAKLLFKEWYRRSHETNLVTLSYEISKEINAAKDIMRDYFTTLSDSELSEEQYTNILMKHCPNILVEKYRERILERLPRAHKIAIMSATLASRLIYKEGLNWLDSMDSEQVVRTAFDYLRAEEQIEEFIENVNQSSLVSKEDIISILRGAGAKHLSSRGSPSH